MNLFGKKIEQGDTVYSGSLGYGIVKTITPTQITITHSGNTWNYNDKLVRTGCKIPDLYWMPPKAGVQIKSQDKQDNVLTAITSIESILTNLVN